MATPIFINPLTPMNGEVLDTLREGIEEAFDSAVAVSTQADNLVDYAFNAKRKQYLAPLILSTLRDLKAEPGAHYLGIVDVDLYSPGFNYVFGETDIGSRVALVSLYRLKPERYGLPPNETVFSTRMLKEAVHELGHTYYLNHCQSPRCVMHSSQNLNRTDLKRASFCPACQHQLEEAL
ncbi:MAG: archaemetzincin family Zn-dependent metalloprotease [Chloroflexota bacterium]